MNANVKKWTVYFGLLDRMEAEINETLYQQAHKKRKDKFGSKKFYANNFKKSKIKKKK